jgi:small GTP-binding protein
MIDHHPSKVVFAGDSNVGKTSLINVCIGGHLSPSPSLGAEVTNLQVSCEGETVSLALWDTAGQEEYQSLVPFYFRGAELGVFVFDVTDRLTFENIPDWCQMISTTANLPTIFIVGNKADLPDRTVLFQEGQERALTLNATYLETSAKTSLGIDTLKHELAHAVKNREKPKQVTVVAIETRESPQSCGGC